MINYTLKEYVNKQLKFHLLSLVVGEPEYNGKTMVIKDMTFEDVKHVMKAMKKPSTWDNIKGIFGRCFGVTDDLDKWYWSGTIKEFYSARNYIITEFTRLIKQEQQLLSSIESVDTMLWKQAGGERLNRFGGVLPLNQLGKMYNIFPFELQKKKYMEILILLTLEKEKGEIEAKYNKLKQSVK